jgi:hypothetical protein
MWRVCCRFLGALVTSCRRGVIVKKHHIVPSSRFSKNKILGLYQIHWKTVIEGRNRYKDYHERRDTDLEVGPN